MTGHLLIHGARLLDPATGLDGLGYLLVQDGRIAALGRGQAPPMAEGTPVLDAGDACLAPGLVDLRVRLGWPGAAHKERIATGTAAAAAGGVTSLALVPDTDPPVDNAAMVESVARRARQARSVKVHCMAALTRGLAGRELADLGAMAEAGAVGFTDGAKPLADARLLRRALSYATLFGRPVVHHADEPSLSAGGVMNEGHLADRLGLAGIPAAAEAIGVERDLRLLELSGGRLHLAQLSTAAAIQAVRSAKARGLAVTCDVTPHHLALNELEVEGYRTFAKVRPPLRGEDDRRAVVEGLADGTVDAIASDHDPQDQDSKRLPFAQAAFGVAGVQTLFPVALRLVHDGSLPLLDLLARLTAGPADILGIAAGRLAVGAAADLVLFDLERPWKVQEAELLSHSKNSAFIGRLMQGRVLGTWIDGRRIHPPPEGAP